MTQLPPLGTLEERTVSFSVTYVTPSHRAPINGYAFPITGYVNPEGRLVELTEDMAIPFGGEDPELARDAVLGGLEEDFKVRRSYHRPYQVTADKTIIVPKEAMNEALKRRPLFVVEGVINYGWDSFEDKPIPPKREHL